MKIVQHIDELLFEHDCVILPDFGGFVGDYVAAKLNEETGVILPPSKYIIFNKHLVNNDGLLIHAVSKKENISYDKAAELLAGFVSKIKSELSETRRFEMGEIGYFYYDTSNKVCFKHYGKNYSLDSFGLQEFIFDRKVTNTEVAKVQESATKKVTPIIQIATESTSNTDDGRLKKKNYWWVAAALLPIAFYSTWIPLKTNLFKDSSEFKLSDLNPFTFQKPTRFYSNDVFIQKLKNEELEPVEELPLDEYSLFKLDENTVFVVKPSITKPDVKVDSTFVEIKDVVEKTNVANAKKGYFVIGGCFGKKSNADKMVEDFLKKGFAAEIIDKNKDLYRVSIAHLSSRKEAKKVKEQLKEDGVSSWILKK